MVRTYIILLGVDLLDKEEEKINCSIIDNYLSLFTALSYKENLKVFSAARNGLVISKPILDKLGISKIKCRKALEQLKNAGLIEKKDYEAKDPEQQEQKREAGTSLPLSYSYVHTKLGSIVYQRNILEMQQYIKSSDKMQMMDTIIQAQKSPDAVAMFNEQIISNIIGSRGTSSSNGNATTTSSSSSYIPSPSLISTPEDVIVTGNDIARTTASKASIISSYDSTIQLLRERIEYCKSEILIATRISPEVIINKVLEKSKLGVKVKVVADIDLVKGYFESQQNSEFAVHNSNDKGGKIASDSSTSIASGSRNPKAASITSRSKDPGYKRQKNIDTINNNYDDNNHDNDNSRHYHHHLDDYHQEERKQIIANPYYPNTPIRRRISDLPFGMIILDSNEVGVELVNSSNTNDFFAAVWIKDEKFARAMKNFYLTIWDNACESMEEATKKEVE